MIQRRPQRRGYLLRLAPRDRLVNRARRIRTRAPPYLRISVRRLLVGQAAEGVQDSVAKVAFGPHETRDETLNYRRFVDAVQRAQSAGLNLLVRRVQSAEADIGCLQLA